MEAAHRQRHTRRGFLRGDSLPKFFPLPSGASSPAVTLSQPALLPAVIPPPAPMLSEPEPPDTPQQPSSEPVNAAAAQVLDFSPTTPADVLTSLEDALSAEHGHAFLSWLADQIAEQALPNKPASPPPAAQLVSDDLFDFSPDDYYDPHIEFELNDKSLLTHEHDDWSDLECEFEAAYSDADEHAEICSYLSAQLTRGKTHPQVEISPDGGRMELFAEGSRVVKDVLGRVVEVHSQYGDRLYLRYGVFGNLECFQRTDSHGRTQSEARKDKHGVVVRDQEGRVRAAGESMTVDPRGCFYLHSVDGQYFSLDLVTGIHSERRRVYDDHGYTRFVTSLFTHDGFRMATRFGPPVRYEGTKYGECEYASAFRFYGRDGTVIEFATEDDLHELKPTKVSAPAGRPLHRSWLEERQATTAWDSVHDYLLRVS